MKILVTGNMGYVGPVVMRHLRSIHKDATLIGFDIGYFANCITTDEVFPECRVDVQHFGDMRQFPKDILKNVDAIVHLAAISNDPIGNLFEKVTLDINYRASIQLAKMARKAGVNTFVFASSCSMYGPGEERARTENCPLNPLTAYAKSKVLTERELQQLASREFKVTSLRFSTACGMSDRLRLDLVLNDFVTCAITSGRISILSDGTPWRPLINVRDMARAVDWAITRHLSTGGPFLAVNIGINEWNYQVRDLAETVAKVVPGVDISINKNAQPDRRSYRVSFDLYRNLAPEHQPKFDLIASIDEVKKGLEDMGFNDPDFRNSRYMRLKVLTQLRDRGLLNKNLEWAHQPYRFHS